jgi:hypothetical protein
MIAGLIQPIVIKAQPVDNGALFRQPEYAGPWVALLRARRNRSELDKSEADIQGAFYNLGIFIETGSHAKRVGKMKAETVYGQYGVVRRARLSGQAETKRL